MLLTTVTQTLQNFAFEHFITYNTVYMSGMYDDG